MGTMGKINRTKIINRLIKLYGYNSYLEIGVYKPKRNFNLIKCQLKHGVDPNGCTTYNMTSDEFFATADMDYDIVFVDGRHTEEQSFKDVENALMILKENGTVVMHDCNPPTEWHQRDVKGKGDWNGTVWKAFAKLRMSRRDLSMLTVDCDWGVGIIRRGEQTCFPKCELTYKVLEFHRTEMLNLITPEAFFECFSSKAKN